MRTLKIYKIVKELYLSFSTSDPRSRDDEIVCSGAIYVEGNSIFWYDENLKKWVETLDCGCVHEEWERDGKIVRVI